VVPWSIAAAYFAIRLPLLVFELSRAIGPCD